MSDGPKNQYMKILENIPEERKSEIRQTYLDTDPETLIVKRKEGLSFFQKLKEDKKSREIASRQMGEIYVVMLEAQKEAIVQKCTLGLDIKKKELFLQYLHEAEVKNQEMFSMSADIDAALNDVYDKKVDQVDDMVSKRLQELNDRKSSGKIPVEIYGARKKDLYERGDKQIDRLQVRLDKLLTSHFKIYEQATDVLKQRVIGADGVI
jgi:hypothetical protein